MKTCGADLGLRSVREGLIDELLVVTPPDKYTGRGLKTVHTRELFTRMRCPARVDAD